jgi:acyl-CoA synthetase (AMP-forming)/AMP-acid ligase II
MTQTIGSILLRAELEAPDSPALFAGDVVLSFGDLADQSRRLATYLSRRGIQPGQRVALLLSNSVSFVAAHYALAWIGAVIVPINPLTGAQVIRFALEKSRAICLLGSDSLLADVNAPAGLPLIGMSEEDGAIRLRIAGSNEPDMVLSDVPRAEAAPVAQEGDPALIFFTSGTTGTPKGVLLTHRQVLFGADAWATRWSFHSRTISLMAAPYFHVVYNPLVLGAHRRLGATVVQGDLSVRGVTAAVERYRVTALMGTPALMRQLASERRGRQHDLSSLASLIYGAAPTQAAVVQALGEHFPGVARYNCYGLTETSSALTCLAEEDIPGHEASVGRAHPGVSIRIADGHGREVRRGERGEVCAHGINVIPAYFEAPEISAQRFYGEWLRTGDVGYYDEQGFLYLLDRVDDQINIDGEKFYPCQIEEVLAGDPAVNEAVAIGIPHPRKGQTVSAFVVAEAGCAVDVDALRRRCLELLPACAVPRRITVLDQIPRNPTGKVLRRELALLSDA